MNGSRPTSQRPTDRSSLDALNRTIEGLEARIEGLMGSSKDRAPTSRDPLDERRADGRPPALRQPVSRPPMMNEDRAVPQRAPQAAPTSAGDPLAEIRERQRMLAATRQPDAQPVRAPRGETRYQPPAQAAAMPQAAYRAAPDRRPAADLGYDAGAGHPRAPAPRSERAMAARIADTSMQDIAEALVNLRHELKQDIADGVAREMSTLQSEMRSIRSVAEDQSFTETLRSDFSRLAESINQLGYGNSPDAAALRAEFNELRNAMDGLAREDSVQRMESRWQGLESRIEGFETEALHDEMLQLAYRIDDIKAQLGSMSDNPTVRALEQKLINIATAMEQLGSRMQPSDAAYAEQFTALDLRLDEITRAIAAGSRAAAAASLDNAFLQRLEGRIGSLAEQVDAINHAVSYQPDPSEALSQRIEALTARIEDLTDEQAAMRLEERLEQLSVLLKQAQKPAYQDELSLHLTDISRKIDSLDNGSVNDLLAERLDYLARRIDEMEYHPAGQSARDEVAFGRIETRLGDIAARLDEAASAPRGDDVSLRNLEDQIAHLSSLISDPRPASAIPEALDSRMAAIENYMAMNDEYIIEAARQAAEAVVDAYSRNAVAGAPIASADMAALAALADDLRHLEDLTRGSDERSHQTFEALHGTLVQIADRLDMLEDHIVSAAPAQRAEAYAPAYAEPAQPAFGRQPKAPAAQPLSAQAQHSAHAQLSAQALNALAEADTAPAMRAMDDADTQVIVPPQAVQAPQALAIDDAPGKPGLLASLTRRFRSSSKTDAVAREPRALVEPVPSIDPADMLPPERQNDLIEPGSGAPDVKKILERVRASQAAGEFDADKMSKSDRADYIAAARRAAKAAAQETDPSQPKASRSAKLAKPAIAGAGFGAKLSQHRRPILMAVGAILLAVMATSLTKNFLGGHSAPQQQAAVEAPAALPQTPAAPAAARTETAPQAIAPAAPAADTQAPAAQPAAGQGVDAGPIQPTELPPAAPAGLASQDHLTDPQSTAGQTAGFRSSTDAGAQDGGFTADTTLQQAQPITVPAGLGPKSLADAAAAGDANALFEIGSRFTDGRGVKVDLAEAAKWYQMAADRGLAPAQYRIANLYEKGTGVERDLAKAMTYYRQAANAGNASAMHNLAVLYASGAAGQPNYQAAVEWFSKAADYGVADSQFNLAILYARGNGVKQDLQESYKWFAVAAQAGDKDAAQKRDEVANAMRKDQLDGARARVDLWKVKPIDPKANAVNLPDDWASTGKPLTTASVDMGKAIRNIQAILNKNGFDAGTPDGKLGAKTVSAIKAFQASVGQEPSGRINDALVKELLARNK